MAKSSKTTQNFIPIKDIRDDIVILKNGSLRVILIASSINFALKSEEEQTATLLQFQNVLNSLDFSLQIFVQSLRLDIRPYITRLESRVKEQENDLIKIQTREYVDFIKNFTESVNIMSKSFFVVIPYAPPIVDSAGGLLGFFKKNNEEGESSDAKHQESRAQLEQRISIVEQGLHATGVRTARLGTEELVEFYYKLFNPGDLSKPIEQKDVAS